MEEKAVFGTVQHRNTLKYRYLMTAFLYVLRGASHTVTSRELVRQVPTQIGCPPLSLWGHSPQSPAARQRISKVLSEILLTNTLIGCII